MRTPLARARGSVELLSTGGVIAQGSAGRLRPASLVRMSPWLPLGVPVRGSDCEVALAPARIRGLLGQDSCLGVVVGSELGEIPGLIGALGHELGNPAKPVVLTGARVPVHRVGTDAPGNVADAIRVALSAEAWGLGVLVVLGGRVHAGAEIAFEAGDGAGLVRSEPWGPIGLVSERGVEIVRRPIAGPGVAGPG